MTEEEWIDICASCGKERKLNPAPFSNYEDPYGWCDECIRAYEEMEREYFKDEYEREAE